MSPNCFEEALELQDMTGRLLAEGRQQEAELCCRQAISLFESLSGPDSADVANLLNELAEILELKGSLEEALASARRSADIMRGAAAGVEGGDGYRILTQSLGLSGGLLRQMGRYQEAEGPLKEALMNAETRLGPLEQETCAACNNLAVL